MSDAIDGYMYGRVEVMNSLHRALEDAKELITDLERTDNIPIDKEGFFRVLKASVEYGAEEVEKCIHVKCPKCGKPILWQGIATDGYYCFNCDYGFKE